MPANPGTNEMLLNDAIKAWRSLKPGKKFLALTVDEFEAELKPCFDVRAEISDLENKLTGARNRRAEVDAEGLALVARLVSAIKSDETEGKDSELLDAKGYVIPIKRKSGLHRNVSPAEPFPRPRKRSMAERIVHIGREAFPARSFSIGTVRRMDFVLHLARQ